jgi:hypothetical protein
LSDDDDDGEEEQVDLLAYFMKDSRDKGLADLEIG